MQISANFLNSIHDSDITKSFDSFVRLEENGLRV